MRADGISAWFFEDVQPHIGLLAGCSSESLLTYVTQVNNSFAGISTYTSGTVENHTALTSLYLELQQQLNHSVQSFQTVNKKSPIPTAQQIAASHALSTREQSIYTTTLTAAEFLLKQVKAGEAEAAEAAVNDLFYLFEEQEVPEGWSDSLIRHIEDELLQLLSYSPEHLSKLEHLENNTRQALILRCRSQAQQVADSLAGQSQASTNPVQAIVAYAKAHYRDKLQLRELADKLHINSVHLGQAFKRELGCCFNDYIHRLRAEEAQRMLRRTDMKIAEVAERLGYHDTEYFSAKFKAATGELPSAYRTRKQVASL
nr:AraC family transcriptional regulator [Saccharibacillus sp. JS10]